MTATAEELVAPARRADMEIASARHDADLRSAARVQNIAYGQGDEVTEADVERLRVTVRADGEVVLARHRGIPARAE